MERRKFIATSLLAGATIPAAYDFAAETGRDNGITFGTDSKRCAEMLRTLADRVEKKEVLIQEGGSFTVAKRDEYPMTVFYIQMHEKT